MSRSLPDLPLQMKEKALAASDTTLDMAGRSALTEDFKALRDQLAKTGGSTLAALAKAAGTSKITVSAQPLGLGGANPGWYRQYCVAVNGVCGCGSGHNWNRKHLDLQG